MAFQSFEATTTPDQAAPRVAALRGELVREGLAGFLVPRAAAQQGEYVAPRDDRLAWITGFTGSAGFAVILRDTAAIFVDGRYTLQVRNQTDGHIFTPVDWPKTQLGPWAADSLPAGSVLGFDPWLHTRDEIARARAAAPDVTFRAVDNLIDRIWHDQPDRPRAKAVRVPKAGAGKGDETKRREIAQIVAN